MTRDEFEEILQEAFMEGYNNAYNEIEEILNEDYIEIEDNEGDYYNEAVSPENKAKIRDYIKEYKKAGGTKKGSSLATRSLVARFSSRGDDDKKGKWVDERPWSDAKMKSKGYVKKDNGYFTSPDGRETSRITSIHNRVAEKYAKRLIDRAMNKPKDMKAMMHVARKFSNKYGDDDD